MSGVTLHGAERTYRIDCAGTNAIARIEDDTGLSLPAFIEVMAALGDMPDPELAEQFLAAVLVDPEESTPDERRAILDDIGGVAVIQAAVEGLY